MKSGWRKVSYLILPICLFGCVNNDDDEFNYQELCQDYLTISKEDCNNKIISISIDNSFTSWEQEALTCSFNKWAIRTQYDVCFNISSFPSEEMPEDITLKHHTSVFKRSIERKYNGHANWLPDQGGVILLQPDLIPTKFIRASLHEIGHTLHLFHLDQPGNAMSDPAGEDITCNDIRQYEKQWGINLNCQ